MKSTLSYKKLPRSVVKIATTEEERQRIYQFRYSIYVEEMGKKLDYADHKKQILRDDIDDQATLIYMENEGQLIAACRFVFGDEGRIPVSWFNQFDLKVFQPYRPPAFSFSSRLMVAREFRATSVLNTVIRKAYHFGRANGVRFDFIHCAPRLVPFYTRLGYRLYTECFQDPHSGTQRPLVLVMEDYDYLCALGSPYVQEARNWPNSPETAQWFTTVLSKANSK